MAPSKVLKSLSDETRLRAVLLIADQGELCVCELMHALEDTQPKVSRHLAQLRACGLLVDRRQGQWVYYRLNPKLPNWVWDALQILKQPCADWLAISITRLQAMEARPQRCRVDIF